MPNQAKTHEANRYLVCLICFKKGSSMKKISGIILKRVQDYFYEEFDPNDEKLPNGICARCRNILLNIDQGKLEPSALDDPIDFSALSYPTLTRSFGGGHSYQRLTTLPM